MFNSLEFSQVSKAGNDAMMTPSSTDVIRMPELLVVIKEDLMQRRLRRYISVTT